MQKTNDILYCCSPECEQPQRMILSSEELFNKHGGHVFKWTSKRRIHCQEKNKDAIQAVITKSYEELMQQSDMYINSLKDLFCETIKVLEVQMKTFVKENLSTLKNYQLLSKVVMDNDKDDLTEEQEEFEQFQLNQIYFEEHQNQTTKIRLQVQKLYESTSKIILDLPKLINFAKAEVKESKVFRWSRDVLYQSINVEEESIKKEIGGLYSIILEPRLNFKQTATVRLRVVDGSYKFIQIRDLSIVKHTQHLPDKLNLAGYGAYSQRNNGSIYSPDCSLGTTKSFQFSQGDILELKWNGPFKVFSTVKISTGERCDFQVDFNDDAEIYFGVSLGQSNAFELI